MTFREVQVQDVLDVQWGDTKTTKSSYVDDGYVAYSATGPDGFLPKFDYDCDGVVLSAIGANCGSTFFATNKWSCIKNTIRILPRSSDIDLKYFYFLTKTPNFWPLRGSAQPFISQTDIREMVIKIPDLATQKKIGEIIYGLELTIERYGQIAETLEEIAQAIFKSWFIDFDPVKAKMAGEKPVGIDDATSALFPKSMEDSELGPIPKGWQVAKVGDVVVRQKPGKLYDQKTSSQKGLIPVLDQGRSGVVGYHDDAPGYVATPDSPVVVFANHTCSLRFISYPFSVIQNVFPILGNRLSVYWLYFALQGKQNFESYKGHWPDLTIKPVVKPTQILTEVFENLTSPLMGLIWSIEKENQHLVQLRDALLPRLISGELQIPEEMLVA